VYLGRPPDNWRDEFFYEHPTITARDRIPSSLAVVSRDWKYILWPEFEYEQLFNLREDPGELVNLALDPAHAPTREDFRRRLAEWQVRAR
jgi:arylsulfatase A-like enzyme